MNTPRDCIGFVPFRQTIGGVLIEGVDYAGKTTLARNLVEACSDRGLLVRYAKEFLATGPRLHATLKAIATRNFGYEQDLILADATITDIRSYRSEHGLVIQDRHWFSVFGHLKFFYPSSTASQCATLLREHRTFAHNVYLTSTIEAKRARFTVCPPRSQLDAMLAANPDLHQRYDDYLKELLPTDEPWTVIDTSSLPAKTVALEVLGQIGPFLNGQD